MDEPGDHEERAFVVDHAEADDRLRARLTLADELERARRRRRSDGLPVDRASLTAAIRSAREREEDRAGYRTTTELAAEEAFGRVAARADTALERVDGVLGAGRVRWVDRCWTYTVGVAGDPGPARAVLDALPEPERLRIATPDASRAELEALSQRLDDDHSELARRHIWVQVGSVDIDEGVYTVTVSGPDESGGRALLHERYGDRLRVEWNASAPSVSELRAFASWVCVGRELTVHSWVDYNGEGRGPVTADERPDRVVVTLAAKVQTGVTTLMGGYKPARATVTLAAPLGGRRVIDGSNGVARPSWSQLRDAPETVDAQHPSAELADAVRELRGSRLIVRAAPPSRRRTVTDTIVGRLRKRLPDPAVVELAERLLRHDGASVRRAVRIGLVEDPLLLGPPDAAAALRAATTPALRAAVAETDALIAGY